jgi:ATP-binding cassette subfamily F protein uup
VLRKQLLAVERRLESLSRKEADLHARMAATGNDYGLAAALDRELTELRDAREAAEQEWMEVAETLES